MTLAIPSIRPLAPTAGFQPCDPGSVSMARNPGACAAASRETPSAIPLAVTHFTNSRREDRILPPLAVLHPRATPRTCQLPGRNHQLIYVPFLSNLLPRVYVSRPKIVLEDAAFMQEVPKCLIADRLPSAWRRRALAVLASLSILLGSGSLARAQDAGSGFDPAVRPEFREPIVLASKDGVLEVRLTARQGQATLDTVAKPVQNFLLFDYELIHGTASDGQQFGWQPLPGTDLAGVSRRDADRSLGQQPDRPDDQGLLQPAIHGQG